MERRTAYLVAGGAALGLGAWWLATQYELAGLAGEAAQLLNDALNAIVKGNRLTRAPYDKGTGVVPGTPDELAAAAGLDVETNSLARLIASEEGRSSNTIKAAVAWAVVNHAAQVGKTITDLLTYAKVPAHRGSYGTQRNIDADEGGGPSGPSRATPQSPPACSPARFPTSPTARTNSIARTGRAIRMRSPPAAWPPVRSSPRLTASIRTSTGSGFGGG